MKNSFYSAADSLTAAKASYDALKASYDVAAGSLKTAREQYKLGLISKSDAEASENSALTAESTMNEAYYDLLIAWINYEAAVDGI